MTTPALPTYDWMEPARLQENDWDCMVESTEWCMFAWGRAPDDDWLEEQMKQEGVVSEAQGCLDASGAATAGFINRHYGEFGYAASNVVGPSFDQVAQEAATHKHPLCINGAAWYHWSGVRGYDPLNDCLVLANPAPGWKGVYQTMNRSQWATLGGFNMVRVTHPAAEAGPPPLDYTPWTSSGLVGSGLIEMMQVDEVLPAQRASTWLPLGWPPPADIEECVGEQGVTYRWLMKQNRGYRIFPGQG